VAVIEKFRERTGDGSRSIRRARDRHGATWLGRSHERKRTNTYIQINDRNSNDSILKTQGMTVEGEEGGSHEK